MSGMWVPYYEFCTRWHVQHFTASLQPSGFDFLLKNTSYGFGPMFKLLFVGFEFQRCVHRILEVEDWQESS